MTVLRVEKVDLSDITSIERVTSHAVEALGSGDVIAYPTETVYGLGCDYLNESGYDRISRLKGLEGPRPWILLIPEEKWLGILSPHVSQTPLLKRLVSVFWPGPLTLVLPAAEGIPNYLLGAGRFISLRVSSDPFVRILLGRYGRPITSTSANPTGRDPATGMEELSRYFSSSVETISLAIDDGIRRGLPSTLVRIIGDEVDVVREGVVPAERIFAARKT